jgi:hypothetical protein
MGSTRGGLGGFRRAIPEERAALRGFEEEDIGDPSRFLFVPALADWSSVSEILMASDCIHKLSVLSPVRESTDG